MTQKIITLSEKTKGIIIPNTILKQLDNPDSFEMVLEDNKKVTKIVTTNNYLENEYD